MPLENDFDASFVTSLALREKQIQQSYRPLIGIHKWFARRPGTVFRSLLLAEFGGREPLKTAFWRGHNLTGVIADPFMGGGTPVYEANRLGFHVIGTDINPMATWIVRQALAPFDAAEFAATAASVIDDVEAEISGFYKTSCLQCSNEADVKYFLWVKTAACPDCGTNNDLFPGFLLAEDERHPKNVLACGGCGHLNEYTEIPTLAQPSPCSACQAPVSVEGTTRKGSTNCRACGHEFSFSANGEHRPPEHRMWAIEYHCTACKPKMTGRFFKKPDAADLKRFEEAKKRLARSRLPSPTDKIPAGDETDRLLRWGYREFRELFGERQLLGLGLLLRRISKVKSDSIRHALLTVFSDVLRYQNMLCRYDTYALKCQDIFSVHGFPVGLVQCENNLLGIPKVGSGAYRHFVEKYLRAKAYCRQPFETFVDGGRKRVIRVSGETIEARPTSAFPRGKERKAYIKTGSATTARLLPESLDGVFTDPPYFDNVQYAELMDFCYAWLKLGLHEEFPEFRRSSTRNASELTGNVSMGRGLDHFTEGLSAVFQHFSAALKPGAPFVFTYHHNDPIAYVPLIVAILDARLSCSATLPAAAEMSASLHISGTQSSVLDSVFVCRPRTGHSNGRSAPCLTSELTEVLGRDARDMRDAGLKISRGDLRCLAAGHIARISIEGLAAGWEKSAALAARMNQAEDRLRAITTEVDLPSIIDTLLKTEPITVQRMPAATTAWLPGF